MRIPNEAHESRPWRIHEIVPDFTLEDVWALPAQGRAEDFGDVPEMLRSLDPANADSGAARALWRFRDRLGSWFKLGRISEPVDGNRAGSARLPIPGTTETSLAGRLPEDLRGTAANVDFDALPSSPSIAPTTSSPRRSRTGLSTPFCTWRGSSRAEAATRGRWPCTSSRAAASERRTCSRSSRSGTWSSTPHSCARSSVNGTRVRSAERVGFEPTRQLAPPTRFPIATLSRSVTSPGSTQG